MTPPGQALRPVEVIGEDVGKKFRVEGGEGKMSYGLEINHRVKGGGLFIHLPLLSFPSGRKAQGTERGATKTCVKWIHMAQGVDDGILENESHRHPPHTPHCNVRRVMAKGSDNHCHLV